MPPSNGSTSPARSAARSSTPPWQSTSADRRFEFDSAGEPRLVIPTNPLGKLERSGREMKLISGLLVLASAVALLVSGCGGTTTANGDTGGKITLVAYSTPKEA